MTIVDPEPVSPLAPRDHGRIVFTQEWRSLAFVHWAVEPSVVAPFLPSGLRPDVFEGATYIALVPFAMRRIGLYRTPPVPYFGSFLETNVRLYGVDQQGRRGVVFSSLEAERLATVAVTRATVGLPYTWSKMRMERDGDVVDYRSTRRWPGPRGAASHVRVRLGEAVEPTPLELFLTARWGLFLPDRRGATRYWPNQHPSWALRRATIEVLEDDLVAAAGFPGVAERPPDSVLWSDGVRTTFGPRQR